MSFATDDISLASVTEASLKADVGCSSNDVAIRTEKLFAEQKNRLYKRTDNLFAMLLLFEWLAGIAVSVILSPLTWGGRHSDIHIHVWTAIILGGLICLPPAGVALKCSGQAYTRYLVSIAQMLYSALLIHLTGGRIETHFHIFGSLAFLSFYRDWKVLIPATLVVACDHMLRGYYFPQSVYGVAVIEPWRWLEHAWWVVFEDAFLIPMCIRSEHDMFTSSLRQANVECINENIEQLVHQRTKQLNLVRSWAALESELAKSMTNKCSFNEAISTILEKLVTAVSVETGKTWGGFWMNKSDPQEIVCSFYIESQAESMLPLKEHSSALKLKTGDGFIGRVWSEQKAYKVEHLEEASNFVRSVAATQGGLTSAIAFPIASEHKFLGVFELITEEQIPWDLELFETLGKQIGQYLMRKDAECKQERLANMVLQSSDAIITTAPNNVILSWNKGAERILGYSWGEAIGNHIGLIMPREEDQDLLNWLEKTGSSGRRVGGSRVLAAQNAYTERIR